MISYAQAIILGLVQGITELFPVSSLGHSIILPALLGWNFNQNANYFLTFLVATHFATALVLFVFYFADWKLVIAGIFRSLREREIRPSDSYAKLGWLLIVGTIPAGIFGVLFQEQLQNLFISPISVSTFLIFNGVMLFGAELLRRRAKASAGIGNADERIAVKLSWWDSLKIGIIQCIALFPGFSRTGSTIAGGLTSGLSHEDAMRYSFLLATPIIAAAAILELPSLVMSGGSQAISVAVVGAISAALAAYCSVRFLTKYFKTNTLTPFAIYCAVAGILSLVILVR